MKFVLELDFGPDFAALLILKILFRLSFFFLDDWHFQATATEKHEQQSDASGESFVWDYTRKSGLP